MPPGTVRSGGVKPWVRLPRSTRARDIAATSGRLNYDRLATESIQAGVQFAPPAECSVDGAQCGAIDAPLSRRWIARPHRGSGLSLILRTIHHLLGPRLVNSPAGDPCLIVDIRDDRRAPLFDLGDTAGLPPRALMRVSHAFVSHTHLVMLPLPFIQRLVALVTPRRQLAPALLARRPRERLLRGGQFRAVSVAEGSDPDNGSDRLTASNLSPVSMMLVRCDPR